MSHYALNEDGSCTPCDLKSQGLTPKSAPGRVGHSYVNRLLVSTVGLGVDHNVLGGKPLLFETRIFSLKNENESLFCTRYTTFDEALNGHHEAIKAVLAGHFNED